MAIRTVYNRDGSVYGELNTDDFLFNNNAIGSTPIKLDTKLYPYVKIDGVFYINDGGEWYTTSRSGDSASMMPYANSYLDKGNNFLSKAISLYLTTTNIGNSNTIPAVYSGKISLPTIGKYGINSKRFQYLSQKTDEKWVAEGEGYQFSTSQNYGKVSGKNIKNLGMTSVITREVIFENFSQASGTYWDFKITENEGKTKTLTVNEYDASTGGTKKTQKYILGEGAHVYIYQRPAASVTRTISTSLESFPNYIPLEFSGSKHKGNHKVGGDGNLKHYYYPWITFFGYGGSDTCNMSFKYMWYDNTNMNNTANIQYTGYSVDGTDVNGIENGKRLLEQGSLEYVCSCTCNNITKKEYSTINTTISVNPSTQLFTDGVVYDVAYAPKTLCLGVLMDKYQYAPNVYGRSGGPSFSSQVTTNWSFVEMIDGTNAVNGGTFYAQINDIYSNQNNSLENFDGWAVTNGTQFVTPPSGSGWAYQCDGFWPRLKGILQLSNYSTLPFLGEYDEVFEGDFIYGSEINNITGGFELATTFLRKFSLIPGIANINGWNLVAEGSNWNQKRNTTLSSKTKTFPLIREEHLETSSWTDTYTATAKCYPAIGFERTGITERCAYCLTIEYDPQGEVFATGYKANNTGYFTIHNNTNTEIKFQFKLSGWSGNVIYVQALDSYTFSEAVGTVINGSLGVEYIDPVSGTTKSISFSDYLK